MKNNKNLQIEQLEKKLAEFNNLPDVPAKGWIHSIRTTLKMSLRQLAGKLSITAQSVQEIEVREQNGNISIKRLREVGAALNMRFIYGFVPLNHSLEAMIEKQANLVARKIVMRTDNTMKLEDQQVAYERIEKSVKELTEEIKKEMPRYLWD